MKQQCIMVQVNMKNKSKTSETNNCHNENKASISRLTVCVEQTTIREYSGKLSVTEESKKQKGEFVRVYDTNT